MDGIRRPLPSVTKPVLRPPSLRQGVLLLCTGIGAIVLFTGVSLTLLPVLLAGGFIAVWIVAALLVGWGGIELMAALERWFERDHRFQR